MDLATLNDQVQSASAFIDTLTSEVGRVIVGQRQMVEGLMIGMLTNGHVLLEGVPGLAKTLTVSTLASAIDAQFQRIQFTPDLLPADLIGTMIYNQRTQEFTPKTGPLFANLILADEINRAPAKVQSALLEAMQERQVTIGDQTFPLPEPFLVLATQNPIEQEGTYPLPEAQVDRFMLKLRVVHPSRREELEIIERTTSGRLPVPAKVTTPADILRAREVLDLIYVDPKIKQYVIDLVFATRDPAQAGLDIGDLIEYGASPRASINLILAAKAHAFLRHRGYVTPEDIKAVAKDVLRHRLILSYEAEAQELTTDSIVQRILDTVEVP
ncbi:MoxR family ATPase [Candidatus Sumerlaeota bacterium]|nr:MoxR family ATPase [Candidatus Sumerlaeota bacterium]